MHQAENSVSSDSAAASNGKNGINYSGLRTKFRAAEAALRVASGPEREAAFVALALTACGTARDLAVKATLIGGRVNETVEGRGFTFADVLVWDAERLVKRVVFQ